MGGTCVPKCRSAEVPGRVPTCGAEVLAVCRVRAVTLLRVARRPARRNPYFSTPAPALQHPAPRHPAHRQCSKSPSGAAGWDDYADFYDWENAQTMARRDVPFWTRLAAAAGGPCWSWAVARGNCAAGRPRRNPDGGHRLVGADALTSEDPRARRVWAAGPPRAGRHPPPSIPNARFGLVMAPYGILQSLVAESDLRATLAAVAAALRPGGRLVLELVADLPAWHEQPTGPDCAGGVPAAGRTSRSSSPCGRTRKGADAVRAGSLSNAAAVRGHRAVSRSRSARCRWRRWQAAQTRRAACDRPSRQLRRGSVDEEVGDVDWSRSGDSARPGTRHPALGTDWRSALRSPDRSPRHIGPLPSVANNIVFSISTKLAPAADASCCVLRQCLQDSRPCAMTA